MKKILVRSKSKNNSNFHPRRGSHNFTEHLLSMNKNNNVCVPLKPKQTIKSKFFKANLQISLPKLEDMKITIPKKFNSSSNIDIIDVPISTYETTLFASINRGVKLSQQHPISTIVLSNCMTRSVILQCKNIFEIEKVIKLITNEKESDFKTFQKIVNTTSSHCKIKNIEMQNVGNIIYLRFSYNTDEASGHNITTIATNEIAKYIEETLNIEYISNSGNTCCDKKVSAINSISGRGKKVIAEMVISKENCEKILHTTPDKIVQLNIKKNLIGSTIAGSVCSANAHFANMLASLFLPLGQDIANIVEGSQGITYCEVIDNGDLYFSVSLPNIICGCVGNGKQYDFVKNNLKMIGCLDENENITSNASERMASIIGAIVLCGEISLMSALTNKDELVRSHKLFERK